MHEYHVIEPMVKEILKTAADRKAAKIVKVTLALGDKTGFDEGSVRLYFETLGEGTLLAGAEVQINRLAGSKEFYIENIEIEN
jgi:Zn finger protein HypA/HybF involved in hydrogenase expression